MLKLDFCLPKREFDLPLYSYSLTEQRSREKSTFKDENRVDTVKPFIRNLTNLTNEETKGKQLTKKINNGEK